MGKLKEERYSSVKKSDDLIRNSRYSLSLQEQKLLLYIITKVDEMTENNEITINILDYCKVAGICEVSGKNYLAIKRSIQKLGTQIIWITNDSGEETWLRWIDKPYMSKRDGTIRIRLDADLVPYLVSYLNELKEYSQFNLVYTLAMTCRYSPRLYELLKSYSKNDKQWKVTIQELKILLDANSSSYKEWRNFKKAVLDPALSEIDSFTDLNVSIETERVDRKIHSIIFFISEKQKKSEKETVILNLRESLDSEV